MLEDNLKIVKQNIIELCGKEGKNTSDIKIVAATKTVEPNIMNSLVSLGINVVGENRVQELLSKYEYVKNIEWQFIGALQTNKVKQIIDKATLIQSVDRIDLINEIDKQAKKITKVADILLEINIGREQNKSGALLEELDNLYSYAKEKQNLKVCGFMSVLPIGANEDLYKKMNEIYENYKTKNSDIKILSMGMSGDYLKAISSGSNMIRLGSALFGKRN